MANKRNEQHKKKKSSKGAEDKAKAKKMMGQMGGPGGSPMEKMLNAIRQTNTLAVHATPELQDAFADWLRELEAKALAAIGKGEKDTVALAAALKIGEDSARYLLTRLAAREAITLIGKPKL